MIADSTVAGRQAHANAGDTKGAKEVFDQMMVRTTGSFLSRSLRHVESFSLFPLSLMPRLYRTSEAVAVEPNTKTFGKLVEASSKASEVRR